VTIEGLAAGGHLHPIQEAFVEEGAVQCGFCTPGFILSTYALLRANPEPTDEEILTALEGNLCRCTGYSRILAAVRLAAARLLAQRPAAPQPVAAAETREAK
jgi:carbon-monoxide dehydrogenase small subunit